MQADVLMEIVRRAQDDEEFRRAVLADPDAALAAYDYHLSPEELAAVRDFHAEIAGESDDGFLGRLAGLAGQECC